MGKGRNLQGAWGTLYERVHIHEFIFMSSYWHILTRRVQPAHVLPYLFVCKECWYEIWKQPVETSVYNVLQKLRIPCLKMLQNAVQKYNLALNTDTFHQDVHTRRSREIAALFHLLRTFIKHAASEKPTVSSETQHTLVTTYLNCCPQGYALGPS